MQNIEQPANKEKQSSTITRKKLCGTFDFCFNNKLTSLFTPFSAIAVFSLSLKVESKHPRKEKLSYGEVFQDGNPLTAMHCRKEEEAWVPKFTARALAFAG